MNRHLPDSDADNVFVSGTRGANDRSRDHNAFHVDATSSFADGS